MNCQQKLKLHHSFIYLYLSIDIQNISFNSKVLILLSSFILKRCNALLCKYWESFDLCICNGRYLYSFDSRYKKLQPIHCENRSVRFYVSYDKSYWFKSVLYPPSPLIFMNRLSALLANFESTINYVLGHSKVSKIIMFITAIR